MKRFIVLLLISFFAFSGSYATAYAQENATSRPTPDQMKEFFAQIESGRITKEKLQGFLQTDSGTSNQGVQTDTATSESAARDIMGDDIIFPEEVAKARGLSYTEAQLKQLSDTMPSAEVLRWGKGKGYALMPAPPKAMSLVDVRSLKAVYFEDMEEAVYEARQKYLRNDKTTFGWLMIKKTQVDGSMSKNWDEQNKLLSEVERVPNAAEMSWFITTFYEVRRVPLFKKTSVSTSSLDVLGFHVSVLNIEAANFLGLVVGGIPDDRSDILGLAPARKLP